MYSRPSTGRVDALGRVPTPMLPDVGSAPRTTRSADGPLLDFRSPETVLRNGQAKAAEVTNFIEGLTKVATPIINSELTKQANRQVGELLATQDPVELIRSSDPQQRAVVRSLSPQAQDILQDKAAQGAVTQYQSVLSAERARRSAILDTTNFTEEDRAKAAAEARSIALQKSGITQVSPTHLMRYGSTLTQTDAILSGKSYEAQVSAKDKDERTVYTNGLRSSLSNYSTSRLQYLNAGKIEEFAPALKGNIEKGIADASASYTPKEQAEMWGGALRDEVMRLRSAGKYDEAMNLLGTMEAAAALGVQTPNGVPFFDQKLDNGYTLAYTINALSDDTEVAFKKWQGEQVLESNKEIIRDSLLGRETGPALAAALADPRLTAEQMMTLGQTVNQATEIGQKPTAEQMNREAELRFRIAQGNYDPQKMWQEAKSSGLTTRQLLGLAGNITKGPDDSTRSIANARSYLGGELEASAQRIAKAAGVSGQDAKEFERNFTNDVTKATEARVKELQAKGEMVDDTRLRDIMRNEMEAATKRRLNDREELKRLQRLQSPAGRAKTELQQFHDSVMASKGEMTVMSFPKTVRVDFQKANPNKPMTVQSLASFFSQRLSQVKDEKGAEMFPDSGRQIRQIIDAGRGEKSFVRPGASAQVPPTRGEMLLGKTGVQALEVLKSWFSGTQKQEAPAAPGPQSKAAPAKKPDGGPVAQMVSGGLQAIANVFTPPAAAATLDAAPATVRNVEPDALALLRRVWNGQERVGINTQPLPQVDAQTPVAFVPTAITSDRHPMFLAIGIAEGTRTANGGYTSAYYGHTDPGNGARNVGTVSAQQGGSPATADRRWMAALTGTASRLTPILQRIGLQPGTQGWNRVMFNVLDLNVQAPAAVSDFVRKLPQIVQQGVTVEAIAKARADAFFNPATGRLDAPGFGNNYRRLFQDQRSRAGVWDYRRRV